MKADDDELWKKLSPLFAEDDGGLYCIPLTGLTNSSVSHLAAYLQKCASFNANSQAFDRILNRNIDVRDLSRAAQQVGEGQTDPFHVLLTGIRVNGIAIPDIGLFIWTDKLTLDYRMGKEWSAPVLSAFFELLYQLTTIEPTVNVNLADEVIPLWRRKFSNAFALYCQHREVG